MYIRYNQTHIKPHFTLYSKATIKIRALLLAIAMLVPLWAASTQAAAGGMQDDQQSVNDSKPNSLEAAEPVNASATASGGNTIEDAKNYDLIMADIKDIKDIIRNDGGNVSTGAPLASGGHTSSAEGIQNALNHNYDLVKTDIQLIEDMISKDVEDMINQHLVNQSNVIDSTGAPLVSGGNTVDTEDTDITTDDEDSDIAPDDGDHDSDDHDSDEEVLYKTGSNKKTMGINVDDEKADIEEEIIRETKQGGKDDDNDNTRELILVIGVLLVVGFVLWHNVHPMETTRTAAHTSDGQPTRPPAAPTPKATAPTPTKAPKATKKKKTSTATTTSTKPSTAHLQQEEREDNNSKMLIFFIWLIVGILCFGLWATHKQRKP